jgi:lysozyme
MSEYQTILDISRWQGKLDGDKAKAAGAVGVILRATIGNYYTDTMFAENWQRANDAGLLVGAYHVFNPTNSAISQIQRFIDVIGARVADFPHTMDVELAVGQNQYTITTNLKACMPYVPRVRGKLPIIYTRKYWWNDNIVDDGTDWSIYPLHVAHYTTSLVPLVAA